MSTPTPLRSFLGGVGLSFPVHALLTLNGSVFGISGFLHRAVRGSKEGWTAVLGLVSGGVAIGLLEGRGPQLRMPELPVVLLSGLLVGVGTRMANGCTSGHMISGLSRLSKRSITATLTFFAAGVPVSRLLHSSLPPRYASEPFALDSYAKTLLAAQAIPLLLVSLLYLRTPSPPSSENTDPNAEKASSSTSRLLTFWATGVEFALALRLSELSDPTKVISFLLLPIHPAFDPSLMFLALGALPASFCLYHFCRGPEKPRLGGTWSISKGGLVDTKLVVGAAFFGVGWGISGICPGPALVNLGQALASGERIPVNVTWLAAFIAGGFVTG
ncbi:family integral membrane protein [Moniliophthora roreri MCA 2997]|uniref:Family integral membrane protein n=2 Tax=Moniliophthora roreri TaxID=221103 RepID=V2XPV2_MONRO|nr:family integral membrane protein [Moniliophthora roreri MCA 2997]KAI3610767.1 family integral membrane protein [Moniliophthora roreri]